MQEPRDGCEAMQLVSDEPFGAIAFEAWLNSTPRSRWVCNGENLIFAPEG